MRSRLHVGERAALLARVAHHHAHVVAAARDALRLLAVEGLAHLARHVGEREPERLGRGQEPELELGLAAAEGVGGVEHAGIGGEARLQIGRGGRERREVAAAQLDLDRLARLRHRVVEGELDHAGQRRHGLAPAPLHLGGADVAEVGVDHLDLHLAEVRARAGAAPRAAAGHLRLHVAERLLADAREHVA